MRKLYSPQAASITKSSKPIFITAKAFFGNTAIARFLLVFALRSLNRAVEYIRKHGSKA